MRVTRSFVYLVLSFFMGLAYFGVSLAFAEPMTSPSSEPILPSDSERVQSQLANLEHKNTLQELTSSPPPTTPPALLSGLVGDLNNDGEIDIQDFSLWKATLANQDVAGDLNNDGLVNLEDFSKIKKRMGSSILPPVMPRQIPMWDDILGKPQVLYDILGRAPDTSEATVFAAATSTSSFSASSIFNIDPSQFLHCLFGGCLIQTEKNEEGEIIYWGYDFNQDGLLDLEARDNPVSESDLYPDQDIVNPKDIYQGAPDQWIWHLSGWELPLDGAFGRFQQYVDQKVAKVDFRKVYPENGNEWQTTWTLEDGESEIRATDFRNIDNPYSKYDNIDIILLTHDHMGNLLEVTGNFAVTDLSMIRTELSGNEQHMINISTLLNIQMLVLKDGHSEKLVPYGVARYEELDAEASGDMDFAFYSDYQSNENKYYVPASSSIAANEEDLLSVMTEELEDVREKFEKLPHNISDFQNPGSVLSLDLDQIKTDFELLLHRTSDFKSLFSEFLFNCNDPELEQLLGQVGTLQNNVSSTILELERELNLLT